jgi:raffinose/stachyose/melibiose transport system permease protein
MMRDGLTANPGIGTRIWPAALKAAVNLIVYLLGLTYIFPFVWMFYSSFKDNAQFTFNTFSLPNPATWSNYLTIINGASFFSALFSSSFNTIISLIVIVLITFPISYILSRYSFRGRNFLYGFFLIAMLVPLQAMLIPVYIQFNKLGLVNQRWTLLLPYVTFNLPLAIYLYDSYIRSIPTEIEEAAFVDGADVSYIMARIIFPICMPVTGTVVLLTFMAIWNEFPYALVLASASEFNTIPVWISSFQGQYSSSIPLILTAMFLAIAPIVIVYLFFRNRMMEGLTAGSVKG